MELNSSAVPAPINPLRVDGLLLPAIAEDDRIDHLMHPAGYRVLVQIVPPEEMLNRWKQSNLVMPDEARDREWAAQVMARVIALGPLAYGDQERFGPTPWCQPGDVIIMRPYSGTRFMIRGNLYALINDDTVQAVVVKGAGEVEGR